ncbi:uncharacterized protein DUF1194 [Stella humosa]|uniref:Uncharacterized protein DUF1194 n=1 Tax=Stella humosa TaxID=94 RepID=A0A3N1KPK4_9PROT|nr:DUF1194 domain-containing protein [Stella humosa]ROP81277.1 uncharacterized protein DUF1194 [Stella humosa]BBK32626.1 hypothetical protein STHU_32600 [Stella humosa]
MRLAAILVAAALSSLAPAAPAHAQAAVDLALVLAVDGSSSIDDREFRLQMRGYADAFRNPRVVQAATTGASHRIVVTLVQWSNLHDQRQAVPWTLVEDAQSAGRLADLIENAAREVPAGSTSISGAIDFSARLLGDRRWQPARRVIDVSGDGLNNMGRQPSAARDAAVAAGISVNGLAITTEVPALDIYYEDNVIGGPGAFALATDSFENFPEAILKKLLREIVGLPGGPSIAEVPPAP